MLQEHLNLNVDCPEGTTFSERSLGKSLGSLKAGGLKTSGFSSSNTKMHRGYF